MGKIYFNKNKRTNIEVYSGIREKSKCLDEPIQNCQRVDDAIVLYFTVTISRRTFFKLKKNTTQINLWIVCSKICYCLF